jgi:hypothetical protein
MQEDEMRRMRIAVAALLTMGFAAGSVYAQAGAPGIKVNVPFRFNIGTTMYAAGEYSFLSSGERVWLQEVNGRNVAVSFTGKANGRVPERDGKVVFDCYAGECFLSQVWIAGQEAGRELVKSKRGIQLARTGSGEQIALLGTKPQS